MICFVWNFYLHESILFRNSQCRVVLPTIISENNCIKVYLPYGPKEIHCFSRLGLSRARCFEQGKLEAPEDLYRKGCHRSDGSGRRKGSCLRITVPERRPNSRIAQEEKRAENILYLFQPMYLKRKPGPPDVCLGERRSCRRQGVKTG